jgi:hypothetical protein
MQDHTVLLFNNATFAPQWWINYVWNNEDDLFGEDIDVMNRHMARHRCQFVVRGSDRLLVFDSAESRMEFIMRYVDS